MLVDGVNVSGATTGRLVLRNVTASQAGVYTVTVSNTAGTLEDSAELVVQVPPQILSGPGPVTQGVLRGSTVTYEVTTSGSPAPTYQWLRNGEIIDGAVASTLVLTNVTSANDGNYSVRVANPAATVESSVSELVVGTAAVIETQPRAILSVVGGSAEFSVVATGTPAPVYQWFFEGEPIADATSSVLTLSGLTAQNAGSYTVRVSNTYANLLSTAAVLRVAQKVSSATPDVVQSFLPGSTLSLGPTEQQPTGVTYQWFLNGKPYPGASGPFLFIESATFADSGVYTIRTYNSRNKLVGTRVVGRVAISVAAGYDALLRDFETDEPVGLISMDVAAGGAFNGKISYEDGQVYDFRGSLAFPDKVFIGQGSVVIKRGKKPALRLSFGLDAQASELEVTQSFVGTVQPAAIALGERRLTTPVPWLGTYTLALDASGTVNDLTLSAIITSKTGLTITGTLKDGTKVKQSFPSSVDGRYSVFLLPYGKSGGSIGGELVLENSPGGYFADLESSGVWQWTREATKTRPGLSVELTPSLAP